jgi:stage V sporulation protein R
MLADTHRPAGEAYSDRLDFYFDVFLQSEKKLKTSQYMKEINAFNESIRRFGARQGEKSFFGKVARRFPEFEARFTKHLKKKPVPRFDLLTYLREHSDFLNREENRWMKSILQIVRDTSLFLQPQIRTKIMNEGWASYWHEKLFLGDDRIRGHEVDYARVNAGVTAMPRVGLNPYALGKCLFQYIESAADKGRYSVAFQRLNSAEKRKKFDEKTKDGQRVIFWARANLSDFLFANTFLDQDFINENKLFVAGRRLNRQKMTWEYFIQSRKAADYRRMVFDTLYHPPFVEIDESGKKNGALCLVHRFEGKPLVKDYIANTLMGIEYLWGAEVKLETTEPVAKTPGAESSKTGVFSVAEIEAGAEAALKWQRVRYTMKNRELSREVIGPADVESPSPVNP